MKKVTKIGIGAAAVLSVGAMAFAAPTFAQALKTPSAFSAPSFQSHQGGFGQTGEMGDHIEATLDATVTGVPDTVTAARDASFGGYWEAFKLDATATALPATKPTEGGFRVGIHPQHSEDGTLVEPTLTAGSLTGTIDLHATATDTTEVYALYPSDGGNAVLVTVTVDADGVATATASGELTVAYSADVADEGPAFGRGSHGGGHGDGMGHGHGRGGHGHHGEGFGNEDGTVTDVTSTDTTEVTPNA